MDLQEAFYEDEINYHRDRLRTAGIMLEIIGRKNGTEHSVRWEDSVRVQSKETPVLSWWSPGRWHHLYTKDNK